MHSKPQFPTRWFWSLVLGLHFLPALGQWELRRAPLGSGSEIKDLYEVPPAEDDDCASARAALGAEMRRRGTDYIGGYTREELAKKPCFYLKMLASLYANWKDADERRREAEREARRHKEADDQATAAEVNSQLKEVRANNQFNQFNRQPWDKQRDTLLQTDPDALEKAGEGLEQRAKTLRDQATTAQNRGDHATGSALSSLAEEVGNQARDAKALGSRAGREQVFKRIQEQNNARSTEWAAKQQREDSLREQKQQREDSLREQGDKLDDENRRLRHNREEVAATRSAAAWEQLGAAASTKAEEIAEGLKLGSPVYYQTKALIDRLEDIGKTYTDLATVVRKGERATPREIGAVQKDIVEGVSPALGVASVTVGVLIPVLQDVGLDVVESVGRKLDQQFDQAEARSRPTAGSGGGGAGYPVPAWLSSPASTSAPGTVAANPTVRSAGNPLTDNFLSDLTHGRGSRFDPPSSGGTPRSEFDSPDGPVAGSRFDDDHPAPPLSRVEDSPSFIRWALRQQAEATNAPRRQPAPKTTAPAETKDQFGSGAGSRFDR